MKAGNVSCSSFLFFFARSCPELLLHVSLPGQAAVRYRSGCSPGQWGCTWWSKLTEWSGFNTWCLWPDPLGLVTVAACSVDWSPKSWKSSGGNSTNLIYEHSPLPSCVWHWVPSTRNMQIKVSKPSEAQDGKGAGVPCEAML